MLRSKHREEMKVLMNRGPVLLPDHCGILLRFRIQLTVLLADIEKAFLQIGIQEPDQDVTRHALYGLRI